MDEHRRALAQRAITSMKAREGKDVGEWAKRLARDSVGCSYACGKKFGIR